MHKTKLSFLILLLFTAHSSAFALIGGRKVTQRDPQGPSKAVVMLELKRNQTFLASCTATLIAKNAVLTAAHCFDKYMIPGANQFEVAFDLFEDGETKRVHRKGLYARKHPAYRGSGPVQQLLENDIAVAFFEGNLPEGFGPVQIDRNTEANYGGKTAQTFGYGRTVDYQRAKTTDPFFSVGTLHVASIRYQPLSSARTLLFTSHDTETSAYLCQGDSGGPHFITTTRGVRLIAVTSAGGAMTGKSKNSMTCIHPGSVSLVAPVASWIDRQLKGK